MKKIWIFFALVPLFSYAAVQEEWLLESYAPLEWQEKTLEKRNSETSDQTHAAARKTKQYRTEKLGRYRKSDSVLQDKNSRRASGRTQRNHILDEGFQGSALSSHLEPSMRKEQPKKPKSGLQIETNRKPENHSYLTQEKTHDAAILQEELEGASQNPTKKNYPPLKEKNSPKQYRSKTRERISAETSRYNDQIAIKRKKEAAIKESRLAEKESD